MRIRTYISIVQITRERPYFMFYVMLCPLWLMSMHYEQVGVYFTLNVIWDNTREQDDSLVFSFNTCILTIFKAYWCFIIHYFTKYFVQYLIFLKTKLVKKKKLSIKSSCFKYKTIIMNLKTSKCRRINNKLHIYFVLTT